MLTLVLLCFFFSMLITNDVALITFVLITFVPFTFIVLRMLGTRLENRLLLPVVMLQTIGANLGSMLTLAGGFFRSSYYNICDRQAYPYKSRLFPSFYHTAIIASQVISNVPAALLLSGFTQDMAGLIIGTNLGGLGTLIASMASLISY